jgi:hypothetical protein
VRQIDWSAFADALERALGTIETWLEHASPAARSSGLHALNALREGWYAGRFDCRAYKTLRGLVSAPDAPSSIAARSAVEAIGAWRAELAERADEAG